MKPKMSVITLAIALFVGVAQATAIIENTGTTNGGSGLIVPEWRRGVQFTSPNVETTISFVNLYLSGNSRNSDGIATVVLELYNDDAGEPGSSLANLGSANVLPETNYTFTPGGLVGLSASTLYWLVIQCTNCAPGVLGMAWFHTPSPVINGLPGATIATASKYSANNGAFWQSLFGDSGLTYILSVNGEIGSPNPVPEPATFAMAGAGLVAAFLLRRRVR